MGKISKEIKYTQPEGAVKVLLCFLKKSINSKVNVVTSAPCGFLYCCYMKGELRK